MAIIEISQEENTFKLAVNAAFHKTLTEEDKEALDKEIPFSIVITVEQQPKKDEQLDSLYDGLVAINELEAIGEIEQEADIENKY